MKTNNKIDIEDIEDYIRLAEAQRDLAYHLQKYKEALELRIKELEILKQKAQLVQNLSAGFRNVDRKKKLTLSDEDIKKINNILQQRHIRI